MPAHSLTSDKVKTLWVWRMPGPALVQMPHEAVSTTCWPISVLSLFSCHWGKMEILHYRCSHPKCGFLISPLQWQSKTKPRGTSHSTICVSKWRPLCHTAAISMSQSSFSKILSSVVCQIKHSLWFWVICWLYCSDFTGMHFICRPKCETGHSPPSRRPRMHQRNITSTFMLAKFREEIC
jgi:hypothetical protein